MTHDNPQVSLAPMAGQGLGKLLFDKLLADPNFVQMLIDGIIAGLTAMMPRRWDKESGGWVSDPDGKTRARTAFDLLAQAEGEPIKRVIHQHLGSVSQADPIATLMQSPALVDAIRRTIDKASARRPAEVTVTPAVLEVD